MWSGLSGGGQKSKMPFEASQFSFLRTLKKSKGSIHPRLRTRDKKSESIPAMWPPSYSYGNRVSITVTESNELLDRDPDSNRAS
jgi:hypothetical protein